MKIYFQKVGIFGVIFLFTLFCQDTFAQVGIGTTNPDSNAILDIVSTNATPGGLLLPRVALSATNVVTPLSAHIAGMTVYNTATDGSAPNNVTPGYYYNNGTAWVRIAASSDASDDWKLTGNAGTTAGTNFFRNYR